MKCNIEDTGLPMYVSWQVLVKTPMAPVKSHHDRALHALLAISAELSRSGLPKEHGVGSQSGTSARDTKVRSTAMAPDAL